MGCFYRRQSGRIFTCFPPLLIFLQRFLVESEVNKLDGKPFKFRLGAGEVIKGWDAGIEGMKVGGKRRLTVPAHMAYGKQGAPPEIPPNATLVFDVECKAVN